jgi:hypothetical protein
MTQRSGSGPHAGRQKRRGARDRYCRGWHCDFDSSAHDHGQRVNDLFDEHLPTPPLAGTATRSSRCELLPQDDYLEAIIESYIDAILGGTLHFSLRRGCTHCGAKVGTICRSGPHWKLSCALCGSYLKFVGKYHVAQKLEEFERRCAADRSP